jgi:hypothetical protein
MKPSKKGQIVRFHTPLPDEDTDVLYSVVDIFTDVERPRAQIRAVNIPGSFMPINTVLVEELELASVNTSDLIGYPAKVLKNDGSVVQGTVVQVDEKQLIPELTITETGILTNVQIHLQDDTNRVHEGVLMVGEGE